MSSQTRPSPFDTITLKEALESPLPVLYFTIERAGFGAMLSRIMTGMGIAIHFKMRFAFAMDGCRYPCPFHLPTAPLPLSPPPEFTFRAVSEGTYQWEFPSYWSSPALRAAFQYPEPPRWFAGRRHHWSALLAGFIAEHPDTRLARLVGRTKERLDWNTNRLRVGLHIRRGDKADECPLVPTGLYVEYVNMISRKENKELVVFLTTDDPEALEEFRSTCRFRVICDAEERRYNNNNCLMVEEHPELAEEESYTAAKNILLLGDCHYVVGMRTAQFTWLGGLVCVFSHGFNVDRHLMIESRTGRLSHWACDYLGEGHPDCRPAEFA